MIIRHNTYDVVIKPLYSRAFDPNYADGLKAGELKQLPASHFDLSDSEVIFIDYADN